MTNTEKGIRSLYGNNIVQGYTDNTDNRIQSITNKIKNTMASKKGASASTTNGPDGQATKPRKPRTTKPKAADPDKVFQQIKTMTFEHQAVLHGVFSEHLKETAEEKQREYKDHLANTSKILSLFGNAGPTQGETQE